jgi:branched-chain amino acid transport system substrate-binding protein
MKTKGIAGSVLMSVCLLTACGPSAQEIATQTAAAWTSTPLPSNTPIPSPTSTSTFTPTATLTATPTITLTPTITPTLSANTLTIAPGDPIRIGYLLAESIDIGIDSKRAVEIAIDGIGAELLGHPIELFGFDTQCNKLAGQRGAKLIVAEADILGVIGTTCSAAALTAVKELSTAGIVMISPSNSHPQLTAPESHEPVYLRTYPNDTVQAHPISVFSLDELEASTMATIYYSNDSYSLLMKNAVCEEFANLGGDCVAERTVNRGDTYVTAVLNSIGEAAPDIVFSILSPQEAALIISQSKGTAGLENATMIVQELSFAPWLLELSGDDAVGVYVSRTWTQYDQSADAYQTYLLSYRDKYGEEPTSSFHPFAYDATSMLLNAIAQVAIQQEDGTLLIDREAIRAKLFQIEGFEGLSGRLTCSTNGECASDTFGGVVYMIVSGDPSTWNPGSGLAANPDQVWPKP